MGIDLETLRDAVAAHGRVMRVVIAEVAGSSPREVGAAMLVWPGGQSGTIGGGALEHQAAERARGAARDALSRHPLGPELGQCCGGAVTLLTEVWDVVRLDAVRLDAVWGDVVARPVAAQSAMPLAVKRLLDRARGRGEMPAPQLLQGWFIEPVHRPARQLWVWGAGHVGRALVQTIAPMPDIAITWVDTGPERFPDDVPAGVTALPAADPLRAVPLAPKEAEHLILTYSHEIDLGLCHALLSHGFGFAGLIGSATKWARFRRRLKTLGHSEAQIARITCPIGRPELGKHPQAIAVGVAAALLQSQRNGDTAIWHSRSSTSGA